LISGNNASAYSTSKDYVLFVHGWNTGESTRISTAKTTNERLYWQGYRGTLGLYDWPTQRTDQPLFDPGNFNRSEEVAWNSAPGLLSLLNSKQSLRQAGGKLSILAHSMGGIVTSEARALAGLNNVVDATVLTSAAVSAEYYQTLANSTPNYGAFGGAVGGPSPRFAHLSNATAKLINFNNEIDFAVGFSALPGGAFGAWLSNNQGKPGGPKNAFSPAETGFGGATYSVAAGPPATVTRNVPGIPAVVLNPTTDSYEMFANALYTDSITIGAATGLIGPLTSSFDLRTIGFTNTRMDHSGQFNHSYMQMASYWAKFLKETGHK
jgi:pimeloyl-ACP methyl ester carboxylesterase